MHARRIAVLLLVAVGLIAVPLVARSRTTATTAHERSMGAFDAVRVNGAFATEITAGRARTSVIVSAPDDVIGDITTTVEDRTLVIGTKTKLRPFSQTPRIRIELPTLRAFTNEGAGSITISGLTGDDFTLENAGAASIHLSGRAAHESITLNGTGKIDATAVTARDVTVDSNGVGAVDVRASGALHMTVNGVGEIRYTGEPTSIDSHVNGIGRIARLS
jgi:hypothetical protein